MKQSAERLLDQLDKLKSSFGEREKRTVESLLSRLAQLPFSEPEALFLSRNTYLLVLPHSDQILRLRINTYRFANASSTRASARI